MKNLLVITLIALVSVFFTNVEVSAQVNGQLEEYHFFFDASESTLSIDAMNVIDSLKLAGWEPVLATGVANGLNNVRRNIQNDDLAVERALSIQDYCDCYVQYDSYYTSSSLATDRRVEVLFVYNGQDITSPENVTSEITSEGHQMMKTLDTLSWDTEFAEMHIDTVVVESPARDFTPISVDVITVDSVSVERKTVSKGQDAVNRFLDSLDMCPPCVEENLEILWVEYKHMQKMAKSANAKSDRKKYTEQATEIRICWEFAKGVRSSKAKKNRHQKHHAQQSQMKKPVTKRRRAKRPRGNGLARLSLAGRINMRFGTCL